MMLIQAYKWVMLSQHLRKTEPVLAIIKYSDLEDAIASANEGLPICKSLISIKRFKN